MASLREYERLALQRLRHWISLCLGRGRTGSDPLAARSASLDLIARYNVPEDKVIGHIVSNISGEERLELAKSLPSTLSRGLKKMRASTISQAEIISHANSSGELVLRRHTPTFLQLLASNSQALKGLRELFGAPPPGARWSLGLFGCQTATSEGRKTLTELAKIIKRPVAGHRYALHPDSFGKAGLLDIFQNSNQLVIANPDGTFQPDEEGPMGGPIWPDPPAGGPFHGVASDPPFDPKGDYIPIDDRTDRSLIKLLSSESWLPKTTVGAAELLALPDVRVRSADGYFDVVMAGQVVRLFQEDGSAHGFWLGPGAIGIGNLAQFLTEKANVSGPPWGLAPTTP